MQSNKRSMLIAAALLVVLLIAALGYSAWKSREMDRFLAEYLPSTRPGGAGDAVLGAIGVKRYGESTWFERTQAPRWSDIGVHQAAVLSLDNKLSAKLKELGVGAQSVGQARVSAGIDAAEEAKLALLQVADPSALAREIQALASADPAFASLVAARDSRVITAVGVVVSHKAAQTLSLDLSAATRTNRSASAASGPGAASASLQAGALLSSTFAVSPGSVLLYRMSRLCWDKNQALVLLRVDAKGADDCPAGLSSARPGSPLQR